MSGQQDRRKRKGQDGRRNHNHHPAARAPSEPNNDGAGSGGDGAAAGRDQQQQSQQRGHNHKHSNSNSNSNLTNQQRRKRGRNNNNNNKGSNTNNPSHQHHRKKKVNKNQPEHHHHHPAPLKKSDAVEEITAATSNASMDDDGQLITLHWNQSELHMPLAVEEDLLQVVLRWGDKERGMMRDQPPFRLVEIEKRCQRHRIPLSQACSLRRHHMSFLSPFKSKEALQLGPAGAIRDSAALFEECIALFLQHRKVPYLSEDEQKVEYQRAHPGELIKGTPDFKMKDPVVLKVFLTTVTDPASSKHNNNNHNHVRNANQNGGTKNKQQHQQHQMQAHKVSPEHKRTIHWLEAKMFYGASTIPPDNRSAVGCILSKMKKYVNLYGEGAIVFSQGCGAQLAEQLDAIGVTALSCFGNQDINFSQLHHHQRTWCGDKDGVILP